MNNAQNTEHNNEQNTEHNNEHNIEHNNEQNLTLLCVSILLCYYQ
jgi:hypothetical protein